LRIFLRCKAPIGLQSRLLRLTYHLSIYIAPIQEVLPIRLNPETKQRSLDRFRSGLVPYWAKDEKIGFKTNNARAEMVDAAPSFRSAFRKRRCLIPADGFYDWEKVIGGKIAYPIEMKDDSAFVFAGLWKVGRTRKLRNGCGPA
jgi:putative SOS response-associated peptidase YedK